MYQCTIVPFATCRFDLHLEREKLNYIIYYYT